MLRRLSFERRFWLLALLLMATLGSTVAGSAAKTQATTAQLAFSPSSASVAMGGNVAVDITVANVSNLGGYDVSLQFNPAIVHLGSLADAGFVTSGGNIVACNTATIDNTAGTAQDSCATISPFGPPGPGVSTVAPRALLHASFTGVGVGKSALTLSGSDLLDPNGAQIPVMLGTGSITVAAATSVGGITKLTGMGGPRTQPAAAHSNNGSAYVAATAALGLAVAVVMGAGCTTLVWRRSRAARRRQQAS